MSAEPIASMVMTMEICPNCKREMAIAEVAPVFLADHLENVIYRCKVCRSKIKRTFERGSRACYLVHSDPDAQYRVAFFKHLLSSDGHPFKCLQHTIEIRRAKDAERAIQAAEHRYERLCHVPDWRLHADTFELEACSPGNP